VTVAHKDFVVEDVAEVDVRVGSYHAGGDLHKDDSELDSEVFGSAERDIVRRLLMKLVCFEDMVTAQNMRPLVIVSRSVTVVEEVVGRLVCLDSLADRKLVTHKLQSFGSHSLGKDVCSKSSFAHDCILESFAAEVHL
jgi:hypothetical protein